MTNLGINVVEVDGRATPSIQPAPTSVAGFIIRAEKGTPGEVVKVTNWRQFTEAFGNFVNGAYGAYAVHGFFNNGGSLAYITCIETIADTSSDTAEEEAPPEETEEEPTSESEGATTDEGEPTDVVEVEPEDINDEGATDASEETPTEATDDSSLVSAAISALPFFDTYNIQLLCCPEISDRNWVIQATTYCSNRGDCFFVGHTPLDSDVDAVNTYIMPPEEEDGSQEASLRSDKVYGALYFPWIKVYDPVTQGSVLIPPTGHILGVYARTELERGIWKAPAGNAAQLKGALAVRFDITDAEHTTLVKDSSVNAVRAIPGLGVVIDSSRSLSINPLWQYVNIRLLFNFVKSSLKSGLRWVVQEPNDETLWNKIKYNSVTPFLMGLWRRGAFGSGAPEDVFTVKVDSENNTPDDTKNGILNVEVYFYPSRPAETIVIKIGQQEGGATASD